MRKIKMLLTCVFALTLAATIGSDAAYAGPRRPSPARYYSGPPGDYRYHPAARGHLRHDPGYARYPHRYRPLYPQYYVPSYGCTAPRYPSGGIQIYGPHGGVIGVWW